MEWFDTTEHGGSEYMDAVLVTYTKAVVRLSSERTGLTSAYVSSRLNSTFTTHKHTQTHRHTARTSTLLTNQSLVCAASLVTHTLISE